MSVRDALLSGKRQPDLEKRHEQMKTVFEIMPVNAKSPSRIEALLSAYFLALLVRALIERKLRHSMQAQAIATLPSYSEGRPYKAPTANRIFEVFHDIRPIASSAARCTRSSLTTSPTCSARFSRLLRRRR